MLLALLVGAFAARSQPDGHLTPGWALALGVALGLAIGSKLTAALSIVAVAAWAVAIVVLRAVRPAPGSDDRSLSSAWKSARGWLLSLAVAAFVFVLGNPHLYPNPLLHTQHLFQERTRVMGEQARKNPEAIWNPLERPVYVLNGSLVGGMPLGSIGLPIEALLASIGLASMTRRYWRHWRWTAKLLPEGLYLISTAVYFVGVSASLLLPWEHYWLPNLLLATVLAGVGLSALLQRALWNRSPLQAPFRSAASLHSH
jgi:hypothetical protein